MSARALLQEVLDSYLQAYTAHDAAGCAAAYTRDGQIFSPYGPPVTGTAAIVATHEAWFSEGETDKKMTILEARVDGDIAFCSLIYSAHVPVEGGNTERVFGSSLNTFLRQPDGHWKIRHTSLNELEDDQTGISE
ncbi:SgcJ/EcaC family oxidoreductase [Nioella sp. MMSF_3534]|uniref:YybH family protein n=1 Tax=Nioella sp. MMSF_3534 TaxID=3046720 RepID=UPI00273D2769|nr:SgcJ/EcaC family oxidoreductase [Nioella sp. MMSF_3534]